MVQSIALRPPRCGVNNLSLESPAPSATAAEPPPPTPVAPHGGGLLTRLLVQHGVQHVFGLPGGQTLALYDGISASAAAIEHVLVRDERSAAYAADAYARMTGRVGVCDATVGPGAAKLPSGLAEALGSSIPVVALVSELPARLAIHSHRSAASQALDQASLLAPVTKWHATVPTLETMPALVRQAFRVATSGRPGPVALFFPQDVLDAPLPPELLAQADREVLNHAASGPARFGGFPPFRPAGDAQDVASAASVLRSARRPLIVAGGGVLSSRAEHALAECAELLSAAVCTTLTGKGAIREDHPLAVGVVGLMGAACAAAAMTEADVILLVGTKAGGGATFNWTCPRPDQTVVQIDIDPWELGRVFPLAAAVNADARSGLTALTRALAEAGAAGTDRAGWRSAIAGHVRDWRAVRDAERSSSSVPTAPQRVLGELERVMSDADALVCDASLSSGWGGAYFEQRTSGRRVLTPRGQAGLGFALPAAIGVAAAGAARRTVVLTGDGALGYAVGEMATAAEQMLPITVVVLNNSSLGWIRWYRRITFGTEWEASDFASTNFAQVAAAYGWASHRVEAPADLAATLRQAVAAPGPSLVDVVTETWETPVTSHRRAIDSGVPTEYGG
jgi:acetolactate synthase I/II/III large subunit